MQIFFPGSTIPVIPYLIGILITFGILYLMFKKDHYQLKYRHLAKKSGMDDIDYRKETSRQAQIIKRLKITVNFLTYLLLQFIGGELFIKALT